MQIKTSFTNIVDFKTIYNKKYFLEDNTKLACLSIIDSVSDSYLLNPLWVSSKQVIFQDTDNEQNPEALSKELATDIVKYLIEVKESNAENLVVHCFAGVSRSRAVCLFFEEVLNGNVIEDITRTPYITHNRFVYSRLVAAYSEIIYNNT